MNGGSARSRPAAYHGGADAPRGGGVPPLALAAVVVLVAFGVGALSAYAQGWALGPLASLANSAGSWCLVAFGLARLAPGHLIAAVTGAASLALLVSGYVVASALQGNDPLSVLVFWGATALVVGPVLGLAASWLQRGSA